MMLFIKSVIDGDYSGIINNLQICGGMGLVVLLAIIVDLISGVRKAKQIGLARTSIGLRETVKKIIQYFTVMLFGIMLDTLISKITGWPYVTMALCVGLVIIEGISVWEKAEAKLKKKITNNVGDIASILQNVKDRDALLKVIGNILKENTKEDSNG